MFPSKVPAVVITLWRLLGKMQGMSLYTLLCSLFSIDWHCELWTVPTLHSYLFIVQNRVCTVNCEQCTLYTLLCSLYTIEFALWIVNGLQLARVSRENKEPQSTAGIYSFMLITLLYIHSLLNTLIMIQYNSDCLLSCQLLHCSLWPSPKCSAEDCWRLNTILSFMATIHLRSIQILSPIWFSDGLHTSPRAHLTNSCSFLVPPTVLSRYIRQVTGN